MWPPRILNWPRWSSEGGHLRWGHPSERPHALWLMERMRAAECGLEDFFVQENSPNYPWQEKIADELHSTHTVLRLLVKPNELGYPVRRARSYVIAVNKATLEWTGPPQDEAQTSIPPADGKALSCWHVCKGQVTDVKRAECIPHGLWNERCLVDMISAQCPGLKKLRLACKGVHRAFIAHPGNMSA